MLSGATSITFGQTLAAAAPKVGPNGVPGAYHFTALGTNVGGFFQSNNNASSIDVSTLLLHAGPTNVQESFTPAAGGLTINEGNLAVTVTPANWTVTANSGTLGTYNHGQYPLDGTVSETVNGQIIQFQTGGSASSADAVLGSALTYNAVGATPDSGTLDGVTSLTNAGTYHVTPVVNTLAPEGDGTAVGHDITFKVVSSTVTINQDAVTAVAANTSIVYGNIPYAAMSETSSNC